MEYISTFKYIEYGCFGIVASYMCIFFPRIISRMTSQFTTSVNNMVTTHGNNITNITNSFSAHIDKERLHCDERIKILDARIEDMYLETRKQIEYWQSRTEGRTQTQTEIVK